MRAADMLGLVPCKAATNTLQCVTIIAAAENAEVNELVHGDVQPVETVAIIPRPEVTQNS